MKDHYSTMTSFCLLVLFYTASCFVLSSCNHEAGMTFLPQVTYPGRVSKASQEGCSTDVLREIIDEVKEDVTIILRRIRK